MPLVDTTDDIELITASSTDQDKATDQLCNKMEELSVSLSTTEQDTLTRTDFTESEDRLFKERFENGYDLTSDSRYNAWVELNHPQSAVLSKRQVDTNEPAPSLKQ